MAGENKMSTCNYAFEQSATLTETIQYLTHALANLDKLGLSIAAIHVNNALFACETENPIRGLGFNLDISQGVDFSMVDKMIEEIFQDPKQTYFI
jgi:hypothetical protein